MYKPVPLEPGLRGLGIELEGEVYSVPEFSFNEAATKFFGRKQ
jgi:hypothetical protein